MEPLRLTETDESDRFRVTALYTAVRLLEDFQVTTPFSLIHYRVLYSIEKWAPPIIGRGSFCAVHHFIVTLIFLVRWRCYEEKGPCSQDASDWLLSSSFLIFFRETNQALWTEQAAAHVIFAPVRKSLEALPLDGYPEAVRSAVDRLFQAVDRLEREPRKRLVHEAKRPKPLRLLDPLVEEKYVPVVFYWLLPSFAGFYHIVFSTLACY